MQIRNLGASGLRVSAISYGNWITHGSQVEEDAANACVRQALDEGITTFDTADVYANTRAESVLGKALAGRAPRGPGDLHQGVLADRVRAPTTTTGCPASTSSEAIDGSLSRLGTDYVDLYQAHRYDHDTPLEETMEAFADVVRAGKALYIGVSEWRAEEIRAAHALARDLHVPLVSNQPQYNMLWRVIEAEVVPACEELGIGQIVWSPIAQGALTGKYLPGQPVPEGSRATDDQGWRRHDRALARGRRARADPAAPADRRRCRSDHVAARRSPGPCRTPTSRAPSSGPVGPSRSPRTRRRPASRSTPTC